MIGNEKNGKKVQISDVSTKVTKEELKRNKAVELTNSTFKEKSYVDTSTKSKSAHTKKHFKIGQDPLVKKNKSKNVNEKDVKSYKKARENRYPGTKKKKPK